ncbi:MAG: hypothetical protein PHV09_08825 [Bacteroidales bacterium]|nr:hypothetical protein [Bacteroidales bacterium]MDD4492611.1 hypothetical protein [Bacteroidales bacterium]
MRNIASVEELEKSIQLLEMEQAIKGQLLKEQFLYTYDRLRLVNLLKNSLRETISSPTIVTDIAGTALGMATGYISKKIFIGTSGNAFRKLLGSVLQLGVMSFVSQHPAGIKSFSKYMFQQILRKRE